MKHSELAKNLCAIAEAAGARRTAVALYDYQASEKFEFHAHDLFHAASTIKLAVLLAVFKAADEDRLWLDDALHVRNRFTSLGDGKPYRVVRGRDAATEVHDRIGRTMRIEELARLMITVSSNLATNLLLDYVGVDYAKQVVRDAKIDGVNLVRGVEDNAAHELGINNEVTAAGLVSLCRAIHEAEVISRESREKMLEIMFGQKYNSMIPAQLPESVRVAHKTGEVSTVCHDAGLIFPADRPPYVLAILTEVASEKTNRHAPVAEMSAAVYQHLNG